MFRESLPPLCGPKRVGRPVLLGFGHWFGDAKQLGMNALVFASLFRIGQYHVRFRQALEDPFNPRAEATELFLVEAVRVVLERSLIVGLLHFRGRGAWR